MKSLKELFEQYSVPVDESGWAAIANDAAVRKHNRSQKVKRAAFYGAAALATVAVVVTAIILNRPQHEPVQAETTQIVTQSPEASAIAPATTAAKTDRTVSEAQHITTAKETPTTVSSSLPVPTEVIAETAPSSSPIHTPKQAVVTNNPIQPISTPTSSTLPALTSTPNKAPVATEEPIVLRSDPDTIYPQQPQIADKLFFAPNAFSPNGDGINDIFYVFANTEYTEFELNIFSRNGDLVFQSRQIENGWDGHRKGTGELLPQGVYVYTVKYRTSSLKSGVEKGQILLIR